VRLSRRLRFRVSPLASAVPPFTRASPGYALVPHRCDIVVAIATPMSHRRGYTAGVLAAAGRAHRYRGRFPGLPGSLGLLHPSRPYPRPGWRRRPRRRSGLPLPRVARPLGSGDPSSVLVAITIRAKTDGRSAAAARSGGAGRQAGRRAPPSLSQRSKVAVEDSIGR